MVEPQIVVLVVAGSSPVGHPSIGGFDFRFDPRGLLVFESAIACRQTESHVCL